ncbi:Innexin [Aphelenchoides besseyi]|nr:Innexin [Aphelenchoides besseyi]
MNIVQGVLSAISPLPDGDFSDRLSYSYTTTILVVCSAFISGWSYCGQPITCWFPAYYRGWWMEYALDYCYVQNTYFIGFYEYKPDNYFDIAPHIIEIPKNVTERDEKQIGYYQWVPFILAIQAMCFFLPVVLWRAIYNSVGFRVKAICETCNIRANMDPADRSRNVEIVARFLASDHQLADSLAGRFRQFFQGRIVLYTYLFIKVIYAWNALFQFLIVKWLLGTDSIFWGYQVLVDLINGHEWQQSGNFPRVTLCDFAVRVLGNLHRHTLQCVLIINMFNEKIFVFLWFWFCVLAIVSAYSLFRWMIQSFSDSADRHLIGTYLARIDPQTSRSAARKSQIHEFVKRTLRPDGMFLVRLISMNSGDLGLKPQFDDDVVDRLNYYYTPMVFVIFALTLSAKHENYCFVQNTYFLPLTYYIPSTTYERTEREIGYYQWVPFVLGLQAILFYLPSLIWRILNWQSGIAVKGIIQMCEDVGNMQVEKRKSSVEVVASHLSDSLKIQQNLGRKNLFSPLLVHGTYLTILYLLVKFVYLIQVVTQFVILNSFLGTNYTFYGFEVLRDLLSGLEWQESGHFPRVTMCDFEVRALGNIHRHTVQCVLMINMFNEKVYIFVWWWLLIVFFATLGSLIYWALMAFSAGQQESFVSQYLRVYHQIKGGRDEREAVRRFAHSFLRNDGIFLLRLIATNAGDLITTDVVYQLWNVFLHEERARILPPPASAPTPQIDDVDGNFSDNEKSRLT